MTDAIQKRLAAVTKKQWQGEDIYLRKLGADRTLAFVAAVVEVKDKPRTPDEERAGVMDLHAQNIAKAFASESGALIYDTPEGIEKLKQLPFDELVELGDLILAHSGYGMVDEKKSIPPTNSPPIDSALQSEAPTAPTQTTSSAA